MTMTTTAPASTPATTTATAPQTRAPTRASLVTLAMWAVALAIPASRHVLFHTADTVEQVIAWLPCQVFAAAHSAPAWLSHLS